MNRVIYQAGPLFSQADKDFHRSLFRALTGAGHKVIWPGELLTAEQIAAAGPDGPALIFNTCKGALDRCGLVVALLDGPQADDGTAWEMGYAHARGLPVYGLRTDERQAGDTAYSRANSMIQGGLAGLAGSVEELLEMLARPAA